MKNWLPLVLFPTLLAGQSGCKKAAAPDPLVGHWQSESESMLITDAAGQVINSGATVPMDGKLDVTATTLQFTFGTGSSAVVGSLETYTRKGEELTLGGRVTPDGHIYVRALTAATFTYELTLTRSDGSVAFRRYPFHR